MALSDESGESLEQHLQKQETLQENTNEFEHIKGAREKEKAHTQKYVKVKEEVLN